MSDSNLAKLYNVETKRINEAVKNNPEKFHQRYIYRISEKKFVFEVENFDHKRWPRKGHTAFTKQGNNYHW